MTEFAKLDGKRALITGADRGIGAGIARTLTAQGARVFLNTFQPVEARDHVGIVKKPVMLKTTQRSVYRRRRT